MSEWARLFVSISASGQLRISSNLSDSQAEKLTQMLSEEQGDDGHSG